MNNNEMVCVPRELAENLASALYDHDAKGLTAQLQEWLAKPAEQHQGEPVMLPARKAVTVGLLSESNTYNLGWNACLDEIAKLGSLYPSPAQGEPIGYVCGSALDAALNGRIGAESIAIRKTPTFYINKPLYTHADPGEVERLRKENARLRLNISEMNEDARIRDGQIAERDALLRAWLDMFAGGLKASPLELLESRTLAALSASAEPSAPMPAIPINLEEQVQMLNRSNTLLRWGLKLIAEGWKFKKFKAPYVSDSKSSINFGLPDSEGENISVYSDSQELPGALKEELSVTTFENCRVTRPINGFNMGAPVEIDERAEFEKAWAGAVNVEVLDLHRKQFPLTSDADQPYDTPQTQLAWMMWQARAALERKPSRLVAQLQADLTARDERIDELESQLMPDLYSRPEERGTPEVEPCSGCGTPGWTGACNKCIPY